MTLPIDEQIKVLFQNLNSDEEGRSPQDAGKALKELLPKASESSRQKYVLDLTKQFSGFPRALRWNIMDALEEVIPTFAHAGRQYQLCQWVLHQISYDGEYWVREFGKRTLHRASLHLAPEYKSLFIEDIHELQEDCRRRERELTQQHGSLEELKKLEAQADALYRTKRKEVVEGYRLEERNLERMREVYAEKLNEFDGRSPLPFSKGLAALSWEAESGKLSKNIPEEFRSELLSLQSMGDKIKAEQESLDNRIGYLLHAERNALENSQKKIEYWRSLLEAQNNCTIVLGYFVAQKQ